MTLTAEQQRIQAQRDADTRQAQVDRATADARAGGSNAAGAR